MTPQPQAKKEFDEVAARNEAYKLDYKASEFTDDYIDTLSFIRGASWQFDLLQAELAAKDAELNEIRNEEQEMLDHYVVELAENQRLRALLVTAADGLDEVGQAYSAKSLRQALLKESGGSGGEDNG